MSGRLFGECVVSTVDRPLSPRRGRNVHVLGIEEWVMTKFRAAALVGTLTVFLALGSGTAAASPPGIDGPAWLPQPWRQAFADFLHWLYVIGILPGA